MRILTNPAPDPLTVISAAIDGAAVPAGAIDARAYLRTSTSDETELIKGVFIPSAFRQFERVTSRAVMRRQMIAEVHIGGRALPEFLRVPLPPLVSVDSIRALSADDVETGGEVVDPSLYRVDVDHEPGRIWIRKLSDWPTERDRLLVTWTCGYGAASGTLASDLPGDVLSTLLLLMSNVYEQRDLAVDQGGGVGSGAVAVPGPIGRMLDEQAVFSLDWLP